MKKVFLLTIEDWNEDSPDDNAWVEFITSSLDGGSINVKCEVYNAAQFAAQVDEFFGHAVNCVLRAGGYACTCGAAETTRQSPPTGTP